MKIIVTITALLALSSVSLLAAGEDWTVKSQRVGKRGVPKGADASALTAAGSSSRTANSLTADMLKASGAPPAFAAPPTRGAASSYSANMLKASAAPPAFAAPPTRGAASSYSDSAAPAHSSDKAKGDASGNRPNFSRASELNPPK